MASQVVAYYRVSTKMQESSGLGLESQKAAVQAYAARKKQEIVAEYVETESGRRSDRPQLLAALAHAKRNRIELVISRFDRLSRNVAFLSALMEAGVKFKALDLPEANKLTLHVMAAVAEHEAVACSERTKVALQAAKARGVLLGSARPGHWEGREALRLAAARKGAKASLAVRREKLKDAYRDLLPTLWRWRREGMSYLKIACQLNRMGHVTAQGKRFRFQLVRKVLRANPERREVAQGA